MTVPTITFRGGSSEVLLLFCVAASGQNWRSLKRRQTAHPAKNVLRFIGRCIFAPKIAHRDRELGKDGALRRPRRALRRNGSARCYAGEDIAARCPYRFICSLLLHA